MKFVTAKEAIELIKDNDTIATSGFVMAQVAEEILTELENKFLETGKPNHLTVVHAAGQGNGNGGAMDHVAHEGLIKRIVAGHFNLAPKLGALVNSNAIEAYNLPQGTISQWFRAVGGRRPGLITKVGLQTFVDPRLDGGKISSKSTEDLVELMNIDGEEYLRYKQFPINVAIIRGTTADTVGNISCEDEIASGEVLGIAQAAKASGGIVIAQVKRIAEVGSINPHLMRVPGLLVDYVVECSDIAKYHRQTDGSILEPSFCGITRKPLASLSKMKLDNRKIIARRCAMELTPDSSVNLGIGMPEGVSLVANEEGIGNFLTLSIEAGAIDGVPAGGTDFGAAYNPTGIYDQPSHFDFYDGGGIDLAILGLAETDEIGNINVSKFKGRVAGCGGFINITQNAKQVVFCGTFTAKGLKTEVQDGKLVIVQEGTNKKFLKEVEQVTFSGKYAQSVEQPVLYVTERAVFKLTPKGLELTEIAPGIDLEKDVLALMDFKPIISPDLKLMDERIFKDDIMGLKEGE